MADDKTTYWQQRLSLERDIKNLTDLHVRILLHAQGVIASGQDDMSHAAIAKALNIGVRTVGDAYRRAKTLGLLDWDAQFRPVNGVRRRTVNCYRLIVPHQTTEVKDADVRRHRPSRVSVEPTHATKPKHQTKERARQIEKRNREEELRSMTYYEYLKTPEWRDKRAAAIHRAAYRCQLCNAHGNDVVLQAHHRSYETLGQELSNDLVVLCKPCHARHHYSNRHSATDRRV